MLAKFSQFLGRTSGAITAFTAVLIPLLLLIGGLATDVSLLNAQKRHVQSQADLAAQSAARYLPDPSEVRRVARAVVAANPGSSTVNLRDEQIELGRYDPQRGFIPSPNQYSASGASAVRVRVEAPYRPMLLAPLLDDRRLKVSRSATAAQESLVVFTLRNRLLSLNTRESILDALLGPLGLGVTLNVLGYEGLANARVPIKDLLGLVAVGVGADVLTFDGLLDVPVTMPLLLPPLLRLMGMPGASVDPSVTGNSRITMGEVLSASPKFLRLRAGNVLPNLSVNAYDVLMVLLGLAGDENKRLNVGVGLNLSPLANIAIQLGLIAPPKIGIGYIGDTPPPTAAVSQVNAYVTADILGTAQASLLRLNADLRLGTAEARAKSLNCSAQNPRDVLAVFDADTAPLALDLNLGLLVNETGATPESLSPVLVAGRTQEVVVRLADLGKPVPINNPLTLSGLVSNLGDVLRNLRNDLLDTKLNCAPGVLGALLCPIITLINHTLAALLTLVSALTDVIAWLLTALGIDQLVRVLLQLLGIDVAQAELILDDYSCQSVLLE